jgi:Flp pilus assembly pilin Flp
MHAMRRRVDELLLDGIVRWQAAVHGQRGQTLAEYGILLAVVAVGVVVPTMLVFRDALATGFNSMSNCLNANC